MRNLIEISLKVAMAIAANRMLGSEAAAALFDSIREVSTEAETEEIVETLCGQAGYLNDNKHSLSLPYARLVYEVAGLHGHAYWRGVAAHTLGKILRWLGNPREAHRVFAESLRHLAAHPAAAEVVIGDLGGTFYELGKPEKAEPLLRDALRAAQRANHLHNQIEWNLALGNTLVSMSRNDEANEVLEDGLRLARAAGMVYHEGAFLTGLANVYENRGDYDESLRRHRSALEISRRSEDKVSETIDLLNLGNFEQRFNRFRAALARYDEGYRLAVELAHPALQAQFLNAKGTVFLQAPEIPSAIDVLEEAVRICRAHGIENTLRRALGNLGSACYLAGRFDDAVACHRESRDLSRASDDLQSLVSDLANLAIVTEAKGDAAAALDLADEALSLARSIGDPAHIRTAEWRVASLLRLDAARHDEVWPHYLRAIEAAESARHRVRADADRIDLYSGNHHQLYAEAVSWLLERGAVHEAFAIAERFKSRLLADVMSERATGALSLAESAEELLARAAHAAPRSRIASYFMLEDETILFILAADATIHLRRIPLPLRAVLAWFDRWDAALSPEVPAEDALALLEELDEILVQPLRAFVRDGSVERVVIVPHRFLHSAPFHAARERATGRYLADEVIVTYLPALRLLRPMGDASRNSSALAVGDPATTLASLPSARAEARIVAELFDGALLTGEAATVQAVIDSGRGVSLLHFACHSRFDADHPERSYLMLAKDQPLTADAVSRMSFPELRLVSLASCESGRARPGGVDESLGMTRSWLIAGSRFVLGAEWEVADDASQVFVWELYRRIRDGISIPVAFAEAQRALRAAVPDADPRAWAPFLLTGH